MRIVHVNTCDIRGGAARAAYRLHCGLRQLGQDSKMFVRHKFSHDSAVTVFQPPRDLPNRVRRVLRRKWLQHSASRYASTQPAGIEIFSDARTQYGRTMTDQIPDCEIVNLHWVADFLDYETFFGNVPRQCPVVWTLHDMNAFTGGCHYDLGCSKYNTGCGTCPQLGSQCKNDLSGQIWLRKRTGFAQIPNRRLHIVSPSKWLAVEAQRSVLLGSYPVAVIPYGLDAKAFAPRNRGSARCVLGIPPDVTVLLFIADSVANKRKGLAELLECFHRLPADAKLHLLTVGSGVAQSSLNFPAQHLGSVGDDRLLSLVYSAADFLVIPSLQDNLPNTVMESMSCGTPVVGFDVGGIPDMVRPMETGLLAKSGDVADLAHQIQWMIDHPEDRMRMGQNARQVVEREFTLEIQAHRYFDLYQNLLDRRP